MYTYYTQFYLPVICTDADTILCNRFPARIYTSPPLFLPTPRPSVCSYGKGLYVRTEIDKVNVTYYMIQLTFHFISFYVQYSAV